MFSTNGEKRISRYVIPIYTDNKVSLYQYIKEKKDFWNEDTKYKPRYLSSCVKAHFEGDDDMDISTYFLTDTGYDSIGYPYRRKLLEMKSIVKKGNDRNLIEQVFNFRINKTSLWLFATGISFIAIDVQYPETYGLKEIADFSFSFSRMLQAGHENEIVFTTAEDRHIIDISTHIKGFAEKTSSELMINDDVVQSFHVVSQKTDKIGLNEWERYALALSRGLAGNAMVTDSDVTSHCVNYTQAEGVHWIADSFSVVSYSEYLESDDYSFAPVHAGNALNNYFFFYLLALHAREFLVKINTEIIDSYYINKKNRKARKKIIKIQKKIMLFDAVFSHRNVSKHAPYQFFYEKLTGLFDIDNLRADVKSNLAQINYYDKEKEQRESKAFRLFVSLFGLVSIINSTFTLVESFSDFGTIKSIALIVLFALEGIAVAWCLIWAFKEKRN